MNPLRRWRLERELSQEGLANGITEATGFKITQGMVSSWERGVCKPSLSCISPIKQFTDGQIDENSFNGEGHGASA